MSTLVRGGFVLLLILGFAVGDGLQAGGLTSLTTSQELALGQSFAEAVDRQYPLLNDPYMKWYMNFRGRQLVEHSERKDIPYFFRIVDSSEINAFAIPGGHIYMNLGIFQVAENEGELLGIVAHEIGHIVGRHGAKQIVRQQWASVALTSALYSYPNYYAYLAGNLFGGLGFLKMSRDAERDADRIGFQIMVDSGYDPQAMVGIFEKLQERYKREPRRLAKLFSTHPPTLERIENLKVMLSESAHPEGLRLTSNEFDEIKKRVDDLYPAPSPDEEWEKQQKENVVADQTTGTEETQS